MKTYHIKYFVFPILIFFACGKEKIELVFEISELTPGIPIQAIRFFDSDEGIAVGGTVWTYGQSLHTLDGGETWQIDSLSNQIMNGLEIGPGGKMWTTGFNGYLYSRGRGDAVWDFHRLSLWNPFWDLCLTGEGKIIPVAGLGYGEGVIGVFDQDFSTDTSHQFLEEIHAIDRAPDGGLHAVGFGVVLRSEDEGQSWIRNDAKGDFFQDVYFPTSTTGFAIGLSGTIIKTNDGGKSWTFLRNGGGIWTSDIRFRAVHFLDADFGFLAGDEGCLWQTRDGGESWEVIDNAPVYDYTDVFLQEGVGWLSTREGGVVSFEF